MVFLRTLFALLLGLTAAHPAETAYPAVRPGVALAFPADHGAHPAFRTEWWYVTGWLKTAEGRDLGFQVTFFRTRPSVNADNPSRFTPGQVLFAHAAISDPETGRLIHGERAARAGFGLAEAKTGDADVALAGWTFRREPDGRFTTRVAAEGFAFDLAFDPTQEPFLQGEAGYSRKGPSEGDASHYYSLPHLAVSGTLTRDGGSAEAVTGTAWLDREWSSNYLAPDAAGWDWTGLNLDDGGALMAFRIRGADGGTVWAGGSLRRPDGTIQRFQPGDVTLEPVRTWRSPRTDADYPVEQILTIRLPEGERRFPLTPLFDDQELDGRSGGLPVYWEGAVTTTGGRGYLELTGYAARLRM
ncbi:MULTISPECIES: lipocalin-like domain-containing protein [unclassified Aureimonas]|uniref:lipocalin-like domain-containing protein n=1 Tax=unclassified Aureimonas TaxID=2615206 RepID=UPI0006FEFD43|nr:MULTISPECIES: carotenoid 1,2-hydratase [unclassified Aureimonas]KQT65938.1 hydrolase [Aureimonas sp. Leaf427]KQT73297.1 hydrolase [Aureimonas sp. Leaf460]